MNRESTFGRSKGPVIAGLTIALVVSGIWAFGFSRTSLPRTLRVCADPNNLPFSNQREQGFENRLASLIASDLKARVEYTWWAQRSRGYLRQTIGAGLCDVMLGVPSGLGQLAITRPYYRSSYVFLSRAERGLRLRSLDDPKLARLRVGVQMSGVDGESTPPVEALAARHITRNLIAFPIEGNYQEPNPPARIVREVANGAVDLAIVWGPTAGYFASHQNVPLDVVPVSPQQDGAIPLAFDVAVGVAPRVSALRDEINAVLEHHREDIAHLLDGYHIPRVEHAAP